MSTRPQSTRAAAPPDALRPSVAAFMALAAAVGTSTIYLLQPAVADVGRSLHTSTSDVGVALSCGPVGYLAGLLLIVPLVDRVPPHRLLAAQFLLLAAALGVTAAVQNVSALAPAVAVTGAASVVGAGMTSSAGRLAAPHRRATVLGIITAGISGGILGGRIVGGALTDSIGWRASVGTFAASCTALALGCLLLIPTTPSAHARPYLATLRSLPTLFLRSGILRLAAARGALWFFAFCCTWAGLAVALSEAPYSYSPARIGLYALAGLSGIAATQVAGRWTDSAGARPVVLTGLAVAVIATVALATGLPSTPVTLVGLAVFDAGLFTAQVANQSTVLAIDPAAPARFNSAYVSVYFVGGSLGTAFGSAAVGWFGWTATEVIAAVAVLLATGVTVVAGRGATSTTQVESDQRVPSS